MPKLEIKIRNSMINKIKNQNLKSKQIRELCFKI